jgi:beta-1,2-mannobiose phosphorylase / 1,2-beta-oligomannan phosphorylase
LPVELSPDGLNVLAIHYDKAIAPSASYQEYGVEDARVSLIDGVYYMTVCSVSSERHGTSLYTSRNGLDYELAGLVLDHQNKDMLYFEGKIAGAFWALTRPMGGIYFVCPPDTPFHAGPSINLASSPDGLHWKPHEAPFLRPRRDSLLTMKMGAGAQPILTPQGWLLLYHGVAPGGVVGIYRTFWALLDAENPARILRDENQTPLLECNPALSSHIADKRYVQNIVFTTGVVEAGDHYIVASGEDDLACRITHIPKSTFA